MRALVIVVVAIAMTHVAHADQTPPVDPALALRDANAAAASGDWAKVTAVIEPLLARTLENSDLGEAHRLAGLAAFFGNHLKEADAHFFAYLRLDVDGYLDPALYPPEVVNFFYNVRTAHKLELDALRPPPRRYFVLNLLPVAGQIQNGEPTKGIIIGGLIGALIATNLTTYLMLRSWCHNPGSTCDDSGTDHYRRASQLTTINTLAGVGAMAVYLYGVWDGVSGYRRRSREQRFTPYVAPIHDGGATIGVGGAF